MWKNTLSCQWESILKMDRVQYMRKSCLIADWEMPKLMCKHCLFFFWDRHTVQSYLKLLLFLFQVFPSLKTKSRLVSHYLISHLLALLCSAQSNISYYTVVAQLNYIPCNVSLFSVVFESLRIATSIHCLIIVPLCDMSVVLQTEDCVADKLKPVIHKIRLLHVSHRKECVYSAIIFSSWI